MTNSRQTEDQTLIRQLLEALEDLLGDLPSVQGGICKHCGREYDDILNGECPSDDCPTFKARTAIVKAGLARHAMEVAFDASVRSIGENAHQNAAAILLDLIRHRLLSLDEGDAYCEFNSTIYWYDDKAPDWKALVDAIGWEAASAAIEAAAAVTRDGRSD